MVLRYHGVFSKLSVSKVKKKKTVEKREKITENRKKRKATA
jgi:hypothetical protein